MSAFATAALKKERKRKQKKNGFTYAHLSPMRSLLLQSRLARSQTQTHPSKSTSNACIFASMSRFRLDESQDELKIVTHKVVHHCMNHFYYFIEIFICASCMNATQKSTCLIFSHKHFGSYLKGYHRCYSHYRVQSLFCVTQIILFRSNSKARITSHLRLL